MMTSRGSAGDNWLAGGGGNDAIRGGAGLDTMLGGAGDDRLDGGDGSDWLLGGAGADVFRFAPHGIAGDDVDIIADFTSGEDRIDLRRSASPMSTEVLAFVSADGTGSPLDLGGAGGPQVIQRTSPPCRPTTFWSDRIRERFAGRHPYEPPIG